MAARRIIVTLPKGGCGKTATSVAFAWGLQLKKKRTLLVDLDVQGHSTIGLGVDLTAACYAALEFLVKPEIPFAPMSVLDGLDLVPASPYSAYLDMKLKEDADRVGPIAVREALDRVDESYDYIICDCPPNMGTTSYQAIAAGPVLAPVEMTRLTVTTIGILHEVIKSVRRAAPRAGVAAYVPTKCPPETQTEFQEAYAALRVLGANRVLETRIPVATAIAQALATGQSLFSPRFRDSKGPSAYLAALDEFLPRLEEVYRA